MPTYRYACANCGHERDVTKRLSELDDAVRCQHVYTHPEHGEVVCMGFMERRPTAANFSVQGYNSKNGYSTK